MLYACSEIIIVSCFYCSRCIHNLLRTVATVCSHFSNIWKNFHILWVYLYWWWAAVVQ